MAQETAARYNDSVALKSDYTAMINAMGAAKSSHHVQGIMEHKPVQGIKMLDDDKSKFRMWHKKFVNAMSQVNET